MTDTLTAMRAGRCAVTPPASTPLRPGRVCTALLAALNASEGRSRARKRDQTPDAIGLAIRRELLTQAVGDDPEAEAFAQWLFDHAEDSPNPGAARAMARTVLDEWRLAHTMVSFADWLAQGAPSADAAGDAPRNAPRDAPRDAPRAAPKDAATVAADDARERMPGLPACSPMQLPQIATCAPEEGALSVCLSPPPA